MRLTPWPVVTLLVLMSPLRADTWLYSSSITTYYVPTTGYYLIEAVGAVGGTGAFSETGGDGAELLGTFDLTAGTVLSIAVGGAGEDGSGTLGAGGGGGGTFVIDSTTDSILEIAGGGGGGAGGSASLTTSGNSGSGMGAGAGGQNGAGGGGGTGAFVAGTDGGGGGGYLSDGTAGSNSGGGGGHAFTDLTNALAGGAGTSASGYGTGGNGGFGGGGGAGLYGGGGGGYSGGGGGPYVGAGDSGGGGSIDNGLFPSLQVASASVYSQMPTNGDNGFVTINPTIVAPEPAAFLLLSLAAFFLAVRAFMLAATNRRVLESASKNES